jgi:hypothetical protein
MEVIDREPHAWFLVRDGNALLREVRCSHGPADYSVVLELNAMERRRYDRQRRVYLEELTYAIHYSAPGVRGNTSVYAHRLLEAHRRQAVSDTILRWVRKTGDA